MRRIARLTDEELNLDTLIHSYAGRGSKPLRPDLLLKLVIYEHSQGRPQPVQWMKDLKENKAVQWLVYGMRPSQTTLYEFRDRVQPLLQDLNQQVIRTAIDEGHTDGSRGALDGTTVAANATRHRMVNLETIEKRLEILDREITEAEQARDSTSAMQSMEPEALPSPAAPMAGDPRHRRPRRRGVPPNHRRGRRRRRGVRDSSANDTAAPRRSWRRSTWPTSSVARINERRTPRYESRRGTRWLRSGWTR